MDILLSIKKKDKIQKIVYTFFMKTNLSWLIISILMILMIYLFYVLSSKVQTYSQPTLEKNRVENELFGEDTLSRNTPTSFSEYTIITL